MLGTSDAWSMIRSSQRPSKPVYYIEDCQIFDLGFMPKGPPCIPHLLEGLCSKSEHNFNNLFLKNAGGSYAEANETVAVLFGNFGVAKEV